MIEPTILLPGDPLFESAIQKRLADKIERDLNDQIVNTLNWSSAGASTSAVTGPTPTLTMESLKRTIDKMIEELDAPQLYPAQVEMLSEFHSRFDVLVPLVHRRHGMSILGMQIIESALATTPYPARAHKKRRNQSEAYHRRIQKKWTKRFGYVHTPGAYMLGGDTLCVHPTIGAQLRAVAKA